MIFDFLFRKTTTIAAGGILRGMTDWHSHLLPGVDDGVKTMDDALKILRTMEQQGTTSLWLTPHIMEDIPNGTVTLKRKFEELKATYKGSIKLHLAAEYMLDNLFEERLQNNDLLPIGNEQNRLLVETSFFNPPYNLYQTLEKIKEKGYYPVLAHPERYMYMKENDYKALRDKGILFQLNLFSLTGAYGEEAQQKAECLLRDKLYDLTGTDTHRLAQYERGISGKVNPAYIQL